MKISKEARKTSRELFRFSVVDGRLNGDRVRQVTKQLVESKPRHYVGILEAYARLIRLEQARRHAVIESAVELDDSGRDEIQNSLKAKYGPDVTTDYRVVPELIGGLRIKIGSDVFDSSVRERLNRLQAATLA